MTARPAPSMISPELARRIAEQQVEIERLQDELGDPEEALKRFMRETFDYDALIQTYEEYLANRGLLDERDDASSDG